MPVDLGINRLGPADDNLHGLARQRLELLRQLKDLMRFHHHLHSYINEVDEDAVKQLVSSVWERQDLDPARQNSHVTDML